MADNTGLRSLVERSVGVYGTSPTCYLSALARVPDFTLEEFDEAIGDASLVRVRAMRYSVYTVPAEMLAVVAAATRSLARKVNPYRERVDESHPDFGKALDVALANGPLPAADIRRMIDPEKEMGDLFSVALAMAAARFEVVRTRTTGTWRSDRFLYARWKDWLPDVDPELIDDATAQRELVARYVAAYGPVDANDVRWWTGWKKSETEAAIEGVDLTVGGDAISLVTGTRLLPVWDVLMVAYQNRDRLLDPSYAPLVYDRYGNATSVVLHDGRVVGQWDLGRNDAPLEVKVAPFSDWTAEVWDGVEEQVRRIGHLINSPDPKIIRIDEPVDLLDSSRNRFLSPLSHR